MLKNICKLTVVFLMLMVASANANAKEFFIVDVYFDDGSVLHNAKIIQNNYRKNNNKVRVKYENEYFVLDFKDLKSINFDVQPGASDVEVCGWESYGLESYKSCKSIGKEALVTLKISTKAGVELKNHFSTAENTNVDLLCTIHTVEFINKLTGKTVANHYVVTNLSNGRHTIGSFPAYGCFFKKNEIKAIRSIVFKDDIK